MSNEKKYEGYYVVRADRAGVFAGEIVEKNGQEVTMRDVRQLYYWSGAKNVVDLAMQGVKKPDNCQFTQPADEIVLPLAIEIVKATEEGEKNLRGVPVWKN